MALFSTVSAFLVSGLSRSGNPFVIFGNDASAAARAASYEIAKPIIDTHWFSGVGLATTALGDRSVTLVNRFFWNDLGPVGVLYIGGLVGLAIFAAMSVCCFLGSFLLKRNGAPTWFANAFGLAAILTALLGIIAPTLFFNGLTVFAFAFAAVLTKSPNLERPARLKVERRIRQTYGPASSGPDVDSAFPTRSATQV
jgi:O-antigen ligase